MSQSGALVELRWCHLCGCVFRRIEGGWDLYIPAVSTTPDSPESRRVVADDRVDGVRCPGCECEPHACACTDRPAQPEMLNFEEVRVRARIVGREDARTRSTLMRPDCTGCEDAAEAHDGIGWCAKHGQVRMREV